MGQKLEFGILLINPMSPSAEAVCPVNLNYLTLGKPADSCSASPITPCAPLNPNSLGLGLEGPSSFKGLWRAERALHPEAAMHQELLLPLRHPKLVSGV